MSVAYPPTPQRHASNLGMCNVQPHTAAPPTPPPFPATPSWTQQWMHDSEDDIGKSRIAIQDPGKAHAGFLGPAGHITACGAGSRCKMRRASRQKLICEVICGIFSSSINCQAGLDEGPEVHDQSTMTLEHDQGSMAKVDKIFHVLEE